MGNNSKTSDIIRNIVVLGDFIVLNVLFVGYLFWHQEILLHKDGHVLLVLLLVANLSMVVSQHFFSTIVHTRFNTSDKVLRQVTMLTLVHQLMFLFLSKIGFLFMAAASPSISFFIGFFPVIYLGLLVARVIEGYAIRYYRKIGHNTRCAVFFGSDDAILPVYRNLVEDPSNGYVVLGYFGEEEIVDAPAEFKRLGSIKDGLGILRNKQEKCKVDELFCCLPSEEHELVQEIMHECNNSVVYFYYIPLFSKTFGHVLKMERLGDTVVFSNYEAPLNRPVNKIIKRTFDIVVSLLILLSILPLFPIIALVIKIQSPGPIFFKQERTGLNGHNFYCYKFRSMHVNKDADRLQATEHDPRKFAFGNFMRKSNVDELPQFFNVLIGNMSIVGPRPHMLYHTEVYRKLIDKYMIRHFVKPGVTGWAQVTGYRGETKELWQMEGRVERDLWYIENWSIWLDLRIIWRTAKQLVVHDKNAY